ncbi:MAG: GGDEF domain-containing protein [Clostridia bacterium]|nr:GGDEF domain-containing protein [Clostridia bacterium]
MPQQYFLYYTVSNVICAIIFGIMLAHDLASIDRQEKQIKFDRALIAFMLYFISDSVWAGVDSGIIPKTHFSVFVTNLANCVIMAAITYLWLRFVMAVEEVVDRDRRGTIFSIMLPLILSTAALIATYIAAPQVLIDENLETMPAFDIFLVAVPFIYIIAVIVFSVRKIKIEDNPIEMKKHVSVGFFPLIVIAGSAVQLLALTTTPIFCFACAILMLVFYIQQMDERISTDPLTQLNNRGQLLRYVSQPNLRKEGRRTYVMMIDINDFKDINDTYGHAEGDRALRIISDALRNAAQRYNFPLFLGRYGGDEFIIIMHPGSEKDIENLPAEIRAQIELGSSVENLPYSISVGIGYDELRAGGDTFQQCQQRADHKLYLDKEYTKLESGSLARQR